MLEVAKLPIRSRTENCEKWDPLGSLLCMPTQIVSNHICPYLDLVDLLRLTSSCRSLRIALRSGDLQCDHYLLGDPLFARTALNSGVPQGLQNRFLLSRIDANEDFSSTICEELTERCHKTEEGCVRWKRPFVLNEDLLHSRPHELTHCHLASEVKLTLESIPRHTLSPDSLEVLERASAFTPHHSVRRDSVFEYLASDDCVSLSELAADEIARDIDRTLPCHTLFQPPLEHLFKSGLSTILKAVAVMEPGIGYCQGMNFVAAGLLAETSCPTTSLWTLLYLLRHSCFSAIFSSGASSLRIRLVQLQALCKEFLPDVHNALKSVGLQTDLIGHQCFVTLFAYFLHPSLLICLWDSLLIGGTPAALALTLALLAELGTVLTTELDSAEAVLRTTQNFRLEMSRKALSTPGGQETLSKLVNHYSKFLLLITTERLNNAASEYLLSTLKVTIKGLDFIKIPNNNSMAPPDHHSTPSQPSESRKAAPGTKCAIQPPYLLAPRVSASRKKLNQEIEDVRALVVNFITDEKAASFELLPIGDGGPPPEVLQRKAQSAVTGGRKRGVTFAREEKDATTKNSDGESNRAKATEEYTKVSWSLLAPAQQHTSNDNRSLTFRGRGNLTLNTFSILIDLRCYFDVNENTTEDHLLPLLDPSLRDSYIDWCSEDWNILDLATLIETKTARNKHSVMETRLTGNRIRQSAGEASALVDWLHEHDLSERAKKALCARRKLNGGYLVIPLRVLCLCKQRIDRRDAQLADDRGNFEDRIGCLARRVDSKLHDLLRLKQKRVNLRRDSDTLETEKLHLLHALDTADTRGGPNSVGSSSVWQRLSNGLRWFGPTDSPIEGVENPLESGGTSPQCKSARDSYSEQKFTRRLLPMRWSVSTKSEQAATEPRQPLEDPDPWAVSPSPELSSPTLTVSPIHSPPPAWADWVKVSFPQENDGDGNKQPNQQPEISLSRISKRIRQIDKLHLKIKNRLIEISQIAAITEESLKDATEAKAILSASYHELASAQEAEELRIVKECLVSNAAWSREPLPVALLRTVGLMPTEGPVTADEVSSTSDPSLFTDLIALPPLHMQLMTLFGSSVAAPASF